MPTLLLSARVALGSLAVAAILSGCDDAESVRGEGGASSSDAATTSTTATSGRDGSGGSGGSDGSGGGGGEGATATTSSGGAEPTCEGASLGSPCDVDGATCEVGPGPCPGVPNVKACVGGHWERWAAVACETFEPDPSCPLVGRYLVEPSGPFEPDAPIVDEYGAPFEMAFEVRDDGRLYVTADDASVDLDTCEVRAHWVLSDGCYEEGGGTFCETSERRLELEASSDPAIGTVRVTCEGECDEDVSAPVTATRL